MPKEERRPARSLLEAAETLLGIVYWMSGSGDFAPRGQARKGWLKAKPDVEEAARIVAASRKGD